MHIIKQRDMYTICYLNMVLIVAFNSGIGEKIIVRVEILSRVAGPFHILCLSSEVHIVVRHAKYKSDAILLGLIDNKVQGLQ